MRVIYQGLSARIMGQGHWSGLMVMVKVIGQCQWPGSLVRFSFRVIGQGHWSGSLVEVIGQGH